MSIIVVKFFGFILIVFIAVFAIKLWLSASALEKEIKAEQRNSRQDETRGV